MRNALAIGMLLVSTAAFAGRGGSTVGTAAVVVVVVVVAGLTACVVSRRSVVVPVYGSKVFWTLVVVAVESTGTWVVVVRLTVLSYAS